MTSEDEPVAGHTAVIEELRRLLGFAEDLAVVVRALDRRIWVEQVVELFLGALGAIGLSLTVNLFLGDNKYWVPSAIAGLSLLAAASAMVVNTQRIRRQRAAEAAALSRTVRILRETKHMVDHELSTLEMAEYEIRLARYQPDERYGRT
jgi:hypothetical protein